jgi:hypothetical protein
MEIEESTGLTAALSIYLKISSSLSINRYEIITLTLGFYSYPRFG